MARIKIENIGPIVHVEFELNKINIFIGPQSSGKSTIAKILSYCQWVEKRHILDEGFKYDVNEQLLEFHRLSKNYFSDDSFFQYESQFVKISYTGKELIENITDKGDSENYKNSKNIYIPSERNFISTIPNLSKYKESNDNIMSFVYDWYTAKRKFTKENELSVLNLGVSYYNSDGLDLLNLGKEKKEIELIESSSGLQSVIPLFIVFEYLAKDLYEKPQATSMDERDIFKQKADQFIDQFLSK